MANILNYAVNKRSAKISTSGIAIVSMLHGYSTQCSTIGFLSNSWVFRLSGTHCPKTCYFGSVLFCGQLQTVEVCTWRRDDPCSNLFFRQLTGI